MSVCKNCNKETDKLYGCCQECGYPESGWENLDIENLDINAAELVAKCTDAPAEVLRTLSKASPYNAVTLTLNYVRHNVLLNPAVPEDVLLEFAENGDPFDKINVIENPNCPKEVFETLSSDSEIRVRKACALNKNTPLEVLEKLSHDKVWAVRKELKNNPLAQANGITVSRFSK